MSLFKRAVVGTGLLVVAACGFQPMYSTAGRDGSGAGPTLELSSVQIAPIKDRIGQQLHTLLIQRFGAGSSIRGARYRLNAELSESTTSTAVQKTAFATRANLALSVQFRLVRIVDGAALLNGSSRVTVSYNIFSSEYATIIAEKDAVERAVRSLAEEIRTRVSVYFDRPVKDRERELREKYRKAS